MATTSQSASESERQSSCRRSTGAKQGDNTKSAVPMKLRNGQRRRRAVDRVGSGQSAPASQGPPIDNAARRLFSSAKRLAIQARVLRARLHRRRGTSRPGQSDRPGRQLDHGPVECRVAPVRIVRELWQQVRAGRRPAGQLDRCALLLSHMRRYVLPRADFWGFTYTRDQASTSLLHS